MAPPASPGTASRPPDSGQCAGKCAISGKRDRRGRFAGQLFPKLNYLGLRDSDIADLIAGAVAKAPILALIDTLDLSLGTLSDPGIQALLDSELVKHLKRLDIHHHYGSDKLEAKLVKAMKRAGVALDASDNQRRSKYYDAEYHYVAVGE